LVKWQKKNFRGQTWHLIKPVQVWLNLWQFLSKTPKKWILSDSTKHTNKPWTTVKQLKRAMQFMNAACQEKSYCTTNHI
jgi:hypothetical protein